MRFLFNKIQFISHFACETAQIIAFACERSAWAILNQIKIVCPPKKKREIWKKIESH